MLTLNLYLQDYNIENEWEGQWFEVSSLDDIQEAIKTCQKNGVEEICTADYEGDLSYRDLGGESMIFFLKEHFEELERIYEFLDDPYLLDYFFGQYNIEDLYEKISRADIYVIEKEYNLSDEALVGWYFAEFLDTSSVPETFKNYFNYEAFGRDILLEGIYALVEGNKNIYLILE